MKQHPLNVLLIDSSESRGNRFGNLLAELPELDLKFDRVDSRRDCVLALAHSRINFVFLREEEERESALGTTQRIRKAGHIMPVVLLRDDATKVSSAQFLRAGGDAWIDDSEMNVLSVRESMNRAEMHHIRRRADLQLLS